MPAVAVWADSPEPSGPAPSRTSRRAASTSCSRSISSTKASTSPPSTRCCCYARPTARRCSSSSSAGACAELPASRLHGPGLRRPASSGVPLRPPFRALLGGSRKRPRASDRSRVSRSYRRAATWSSTGWPRDIVLREHPRGDSVPVAVRRWKSCGSSRVATRRSRSPQFLRESGLELDDVYGDGEDVRRTCGQTPVCHVRPPGRTKTRCDRACGRLLHIDDFVRIDVYRRLSRTIGRRSGDAPRSRAGLAPDAGRVGRRPCD